MKLYQSQDNEDIHAYLTPAEELFFKFVSWLARQINEVPCCRSEATWRSPGGSVYSAGCGGGLWEARPAIDWAQLVQSGPPRGR